MNWNKDISQAPRGRTETREIKTKKGVVKREQFIAEKVILACRDGKTVTVSQWIPNKEWMPDGGRWAMLATDETPFAWMPFPDHPEVTG